MTIAPTPSHVRVAVLDDHQGVALTVADWSPLDGRATVDAFAEHVADEDRLVEQLAPYQVVVAMRERTPFPRRVLERLPELRLLVTTGMGNASIDMDACRERGVVVCGTGGTYASTAELTWALLLACARSLPTEVANVRADGWMTTLGADLAGATLGLCGLGRIGSSVARVGLAFDMDVVAWSTNLTAERAAEVGVRAVSKEELFAGSDFVSIHLVLGERTRGLVGEAELRAMKPTAYLVNTSRGPICDEDALARACAEGWIAGAGLDTYGVEPLPAGHPFRRLPNVIATPHVGYVSRAVYEIFYGHAVADIVGWLEGRPERQLVP